MYFPRALAIYYITLYLWSSVRSILKTNSSRVCAKKQALHCPGTGSNMFHSEIMASINVNKKKNACVVDTENTETVDGNMSEDGVNIPENTLTPAG